MQQLFTRIDLLTDLGQLLGSAVLLLALGSVRIVAAFLVIPATSEAVLQGTARNVAALCLGAFVAWGLPLDLVRGADPARLLALVLKEAVIGLLLGFAAATVFWVAEGAGALIDNVSGFNQAQQANPMSGEQSTPLSNLLSHLAIAGFYMLGGMTVLCSVLFESFSWWPPQQVQPSWHLVLERFVAAYTQEYAAMALKLAAPLLLVMVLVDLGFGLLGKTAEKLEPQSLAIPVKALVAVGMLSLLVALFFEQAKSALMLADLARDLRQWASPLPVGGR